MMRVWATIAACWTLWQGSGALLGQDHVLPCMGPERDAYLTIAPRPWIEGESPYQPLRPLTKTEIGVRQVSGDGTSGAPRYDRG